MNNEYETRFSRPAQANPTSSELQPTYRESWAVVVGINDYQHLSRLNYAVNDAQAITQLLIEIFNFPQKQVFLLLNEEANKASLEDIFVDRLPNETQANDRLLVFFAGHGSKRTLQDGKEIGYLAPFDARPGVWSSYFEFQRLINAGDLISAKHIFYVIDTCYSGLATTRGSEFSPRYLNDMLTNRARQILTAGLDDQLVNDNGPGGHSLFTWHLIQGLRGGATVDNDSGVLTATDLISYVKNAVGSDTNSRQTPDYHLLPGHESGGDFVFQLPEVDLQDRVRELLAQKTILTQLMLDSGVTSIARLISENSNYTDEELRIAVDRLIEQGWVSYLDDIQIRLFLHKDQDQPYDKVAEVYRFLFSGKSLSRALGYPCYDAYINEQLVSEIQVIQENLPLSDDEVQEVIQLLRWSPTALMIALHPISVIVNHRNQGIQDIVIDKFDRNYFFKNLHAALEIDFQNPKLSEYFYKVRQLREIEILRTIIVKNVDTELLRREINERRGIGQMDEEFGGEYVTPLLFENAPQPWEPPLTGKQSEPEK